MTRASSRNVGKFTEQLRYGEKVLQHGFTVLMKILYRNCLDFYAMELTQIYSTTAVMYVLSQAVIVYTDTGSLCALIDTCTNQNQLAIAQSAMWQVEQYSTAAS